MNRLENKEGIELLVEGLKKLNLIPRTGYGDTTIKFQFQDNKLIFTEDSFLLKTKTQLKIDVN